ncbi:MAG: hypothetical protein ACFCVE_01970 [Phycisphaerae bacterium]
MTQSTSAADGARRETTLSPPPASRPPEPPVPDARQRLNALAAELARAPSTTGTVSFLKLRRSLLRT